MVSRSYLGSERQTLHFAARQTFYPTGHADDGVLAFLQRQLVKRKTLRIAAEPHATYKHALEAFLKYAPLV